MCRLEKSAIKLFNLRRCAESCTCAKLAPPILSRRDNIMANQARLRAIRAVRSSSDWGSVSLQMRPPIWNPSKFPSNSMHLPARAERYLQLLTLSMKRSSTRPTGILGPNKFTRRASENVNESAVVVSAQGSRAGHSRGNSPRARHLPLSVSPSTETRSFIAVIWPLKSQRVRR